MPKGTLKACGSCGGPLPAGGQTCGPCKEATRVAREQRGQAARKARQHALRQAAPNGAARCADCNSWRPPEHFADSGHQPTSDWLRRPLIERWRSKVRVRESGCWEWVGSRNKHGYGQFWDGNRPNLAYRTGYELLVGPVPKGLQLDHLCRNRACVRPDHLEPVTSAENTRRGVVARRALADAGG